MKLVKFALTTPIVAISVALCAALSSFGGDWGDSWNKAIPNSKKTVTSTAKWGGKVIEPWARGHGTQLFNNADNTSGGDFICDKGLLPCWVKLVISDDYEEGKDLVLKAYQMKGGSATRMPNAWKIYGATSADAEFEPENLVLISEQANVSGVTSLDVDCSDNSASFRTYFFYFEKNNGDSLLLIPELYLYGEIKEHEEVILYSATTPYAGLYDGYAHTVTVDPYYPAEGVTVEYSTDGETWGATAPSYKDIGEYEIFYRLTAGGFPTVEKSVTISIGEPPQKNLDITAVVRAAEKASGETYHQTTTANAFSGQAEFTDGINNQRIGWSGASADGRNTLTYEIAEAYRPGDAVVVTGLTFVTGVNVDHAATDSMRAWKFEGWDEETGDWRVLVSKTADEWQPWADADIDTLLNAYARSAFFENAFVTRKYRLTTYARTFLSDLKILGNVTMTADQGIVVTAGDCDLEYDGVAHGISLKVVNPVSGYAVSYRTSETEPWSAQAPTFVGPIAPSAAVTVYWKVEAEGLETVEGSNRVVLDYPDLTARIRRDGVADGQAYQRVESVDSVDAASPVSQTIDGNLKSRHLYTGDDFTYTIESAYHPGETVVAKGLDIVTSDGEFYAVLTDFTISGYDEASACWVPIKTFVGESWTEEENHLSDSGIWVKRFAFEENAESFRTYRLTTTKPVLGSRKAMTEFRLRGLIGVATELNILASGADFDGVYDGAKHGIAVTVTRPRTGATVEYSLNGIDWSVGLPVTKGPVASDCPVYWRVSAEGYRTLSGMNTIRIVDSALTDVDLTAVLRTAGSDKYSLALENGGFTQQGSANVFNFINGNTGDRNGWVNPTTGTGRLYLTLAADFRPDEAFVVRGVAFAGPTSGNQVIDSGKIVLPKVWSIEGSADGENWVSIASYNAENYPAWGEDDIVGNLYLRRSDFANATSYRRFRLSFTGSRIHISEVYLYGDIGTAHPERPPHVPGGFTILVR